jgi:hypothetical protein
VGLGYAFSSLFICEGLLAGEVEDVGHVAIDPYQHSRFAGCGLAVLHEAGVAELVEHHAEESQIVLPSFVGDGRCFDLAFIDGNHRFDAVFLDVIYAGRLVRPGGIVFLDDHQLPAVARVVSFCVTNLDWSLEELSPVDPLHQWAVLRTPDAPDTRPYDYFVDF